jgi:hypothetical protein
MVAREICKELRARGIGIDKSELNRILWKQNSRPELIVDKSTFKWHYDTEAAKRAEELAKRREKTRKELPQKEEFRQFWEAIGFEFIGVLRKGTLKPLFFIREEGTAYVVIGPNGNMLREKAIICSEPEPMPPDKFTLEQVKAAADEIIAERHQQAVSDAHEIISRLRDTEVFADDVYHGPEIERVIDVVPVSAVIFVTQIGPLISDTVKLGWGTVLEPLYLIVNVLGLGVR